MGGSETALTEEKGIPRNPLFQGGKAFDPTAQANPDCRDPAEAEIAFKFEESTRSRFDPREGLGWQAKMTLGG